VAIPQLMKPVHCSKLKWWHPLAAWCTMLLLTVGAFSQANPTSTAKAENPVATPLQQQWSTIDVQAANAQLNRTFFWGSLPSAHTHAVYSQRGCGTREVNYFGEGRSGLTKRTYQNPLSPNSAAKPTPAPVPATTPTLTVVSNGSIAGTIYGAVNGNPAVGLANSPIWIVDINNQLEATGSTDGSGNYKISVVPGSYKVYVNDHPFGAPAVYYSSSNPNGVSDFNSASVVNVISSSTTSSINVTLVLTTTPPPPV
jgi:hypothetical protein